MMFRALSCRCISSCANHTEYHFRGLVQARSWGPEGSSAPLFVLRPRASKAPLEDFRGNNTQRYFPDIGSSSIATNLHRNRALAETGFEVDSPAGHELTHVDACGRASMVDVSGKHRSQRAATASAIVLLGKQAFDLVTLNRSLKGDVLTVAQIAGINAAKNTHNLIPLCHQLLLRNVDVRLTMDPRTCAVVIFATALTEGQTGVEMEALTAASVASLTVYDMCKAVSRELKISEVKLESKTGGKCDYFRRRR